MYFYKNKKFKTILERVWKIRFLVSYEIASYKTKTLCEDFFIDAWIFWRSFVQFLIFGHTLAQQWITIQFLKIKIIVLKICKQQDFLLNVSCFISNLYIVFTNAIFLFTTYLLLETRFSKKFAAYRNISKVCDKKKSTHTTAKTPEIFFHIIKYSTILKKHQ